MRSTCLRLCVVVPFALASLLPAQEKLRSDDFEATEPGSKPDRWFVPTAGYELSSTSEDPAGGARCAYLKGKSADRGRVGNMMQSIDATPYRGKVVRLRAAVRVGSGRAQMWLRVDRPNQQRGFFDNMSDRPVTSDEWQRCGISGLVDGDAERIAFGVLLLGGREVWVDDVTVEVLEAAALPAPEQPRRIEGRGMGNLVAFTKLCGYVRYFHPSDQSAATDWDMFVRRGVAAVESAEDAEQLAAVLSELFAPVAPSVQIAPSDRLPAFRSPATGLDPADLKVVAWEHVGVGTNGTRSLYKSERKFELAADRGDLPDPEKPLELALDGGVSCRLPVAVYVDAGGTLPPVPAVAAEDATNGRPSAADRATRLAAIALSWNVFQHFYPYFDVVGGDWHEALRTALSKAAGDGGEREFLDTLNAMVAALRDGHGRVSHGSDRGWAMPPIGWAWIEEQLVVTAIADDAPENASAIEPGDVVASIDGVPAAQAFAAEVALVSGATPGWLHYRAAMELMRGEEGSTVAVEIAKPDGSKVECAMERSRRRAPVPARLAVIDEVEPGVFYVDVDRVTDDQFRAAVPKLAAAKGIVFDFRGYPSKMQPATLFGHLIEEAAQSAQWHIPHPRYPDHTDLRFEMSGRWRLPPVKPHFEAKRAFITDGRAISYAESCMGIVEHYRLGEIVGEPTAGTNGNVNPFTVPGGYQFSWTGMKVLKHDGSQHHGVGILPTIAVSPTIEGVRAGRDEMLEKAIEAVRHDK